MDGSYSMRCEDPISLKLSEQRALGNRVLGGQKMTFISTHLTVRKLRQL